MATAANPFDLSVNSPQTLAANAQAATAAPMATGYNAATAGATGYNAATAGATGYDASTAGATGYDAASRAATGYDASQAGLTNWNVAAPQTVQGQMTGILAANSPLLQQAKAASLDQMNQRGLVNSSMAVGAGEQAVIQSALPIAQQDASTYANSGQFNATAANQNSQFNTGQQNTGLQFSANASNQAGAENMAAQNQALGFTAGAQNTASLTNAGAQNQALGFTAAAGNQASIANAGAENQAAQFTAGSQNTASQQYASTINANVSKMLDQSMQYALANADAATKVELQQLDATTRESLAATEAQYKTQMQASQSASDIFAQSSKNIADVMANPDLSAYATTDGTAPKADGSNLPDGATVANGQIIGADGKVLPSPKQAAVDMQKSYLQNSMEILSKTSSIDGLKDLLTF